MTRYCEIHQEEPCADDCGPDCTRPWHRRPALRGGCRPLCAECRQEIDCAAGMDRHNAAIMAAALERGAP